MRNKWLIALLAVSLTLNLLGIGAAVGFKLRSHDRPLANPSFAIGRAVTQLGKQRSHELRPIVRDHYRTLRPQLRRLRAKQRAWQQAFSQATFDSAEFDDRHAEFAQQLATIQTLSHEALKSLAAKLTPAERARLLDAMRPTHDRGRRSHGPRPEHNQRSRTN
jgi:uncharacterized membrane protein